MENKPKSLDNTSTSVHFGSLADHSKEKILAPKLVDNRLPQIKEQDTDNDIYDSESSETFISEEVVNNEPEIEYNNEEKRDFTQLNDEQKDEFKKLKILNDYKNKTMTDRYRNSTEKIGITTENEKVPTLNELKEMNLEEIPFHMLDDQTQRLKRMEKYAEILAIKKMGITLTKSYDINSDYDEMCFEVKFWKDYQCKKDGVEMAKGFLVNAVQGLEFLNDSYDPFGLKLNGWSEQVELGKDSYTSVFEELYDKYKISGKKIQPEIKLVLMMSASAASFHASKKMAESIPGLDNILSNNPELLAKLQNGINNNISNQGKTLETEEDKQKKMYDQMQKIKEQQNKINELKMQQESVNNNTEKIKEQMSMLNTNKSEDVKPDISNILNKIKAQNAARKADEVLNNQLSDSSEKEESEVTESGFTGESETKKKRGRKAKTSISINT
jgi:hypothetical protein|tara:strand:+ start:4362 stop:5690 length:1329 start_codon:yes stop_codon:yes gene_type:complete